MELLVFVVIVSVPIALLAPLLELRRRRHPGDGYGGPYGSPARMSIMSYAAANALANRNEQSIVETSNAVVRETVLTDHGEEP